MAIIDGEIDRFVRSVRQHIGESEEGAWTDNDIVLAGNEVAEQIFMEILHPAGTGYGDYASNITYVQNQEMYDLPYGFLRLDSAVKLNTSGLKHYDLPVITRSEKHLRSGAFVDHRQIGIAPIPAAAEANALKLYYVKKPVPMHKAEARAVSATSLTLGLTAQLGEILTRNNSYLGAQVQILNATANEGEIATVTAHVGSTGVLTVAWTNTPTVVIEYEIMPGLPEEAYRLWRVQTAWELMSNIDAGSTERGQRLMADILSAKTALVHAVATRVWSGRINRGNGGGRE